MFSDPGNDYSSCNRSVPGGRGVAVLQFLRLLLDRQQIRTTDRYDAEELVYKYGACARAKALARAEDASLSPRTRRHWRRVANLL